MDMNSKDHQRRRGFVLIVVLLMLAVITAVALSQLDVVSSEAIASVRAEEEVQARAIAESCLELLQSYADDYIGTSPNFLRPDFDGLLDRNNTRNDADDYLPSFGTRVLVPRNLSSADPATVAGHQWAFIARGPAANRGACLVRIEDNSDDAFAAASVPLGSTGVGEGPAASPTGNNGRDVLQRDRDRSIVMTAIGLYPVRASTPAAQAYERAHARVTLKRLYAVTNPAVFPPAIQACSDVDIQSSSDVTGVGGIIAGDDGTPGSITFGGSSCGCGQYLAGSVTPSTPPAMCGTCTGNPPTVATGSVPNCGPPATPPPSTTSFMDNPGFGDPGSFNNNVGEDSVCKFFIDRWGRVFVWDNTDTYANDTVAHPYPGYKEALVAGGTANVPVEDCSNYTQHPVEMPCEWDTVGDITVTPGAESITCVPGQTPCWKPIAYLGDATGNTAGANNMVNSDVWIGAPQNLGSAGMFLTTNYFEMSSNQNDEDLMFLKNKRIPNVRNAAKMFATGAAATTMCGNPNGCEQCTGASNDDWWTECSTRPTTPGDPALTCRDFHAHGHQDNRHIPWPAIFAWDVDPARSIEFEYTAGTVAPMNATVLTNGSVDFRNDVSFCCAFCGGDDSTCQQTAPAPATPTVPGIPTGQKFIAAADCVEGGPQVPLPRASMLPPPPVPTFPNMTKSGYGYAFKADGNCTITGVSTVVGDLQCGALSLPGDPCLVGNVVATGESTSVGCASAPCTTPGTDVGICMAGSARIVNGDIYTDEGSVCTNSNTVVDGDIYSGGNVELDSNTVINGRIFAIGDVTLQSNATVNFDGAGALLSAGNQGLTSFMEASW